MRRVLQGLYAQSLKICWLYQHYKDCMRELQWINKIDFSLDWMYDLILLIVSVSAEEASEGWFNSSFQSLQGHRAPKDRRGCMLWVMWTAGWRRWWPLPNGLKWLPVLTASKGLGAFCCLGLLLCCCLGNKLRWGVYFDDIVNLQDLPVRLG